jgi:hypothetical protein
MMMPSPRQLQGPHLPVGCGHHARSLPHALPVHQPTKYELVIDFKAAKALGPDVPAIHRPRPHNQKTQYQPVANRDGSSVRPWAFWPLPDRIQTLLTMCVSKFQSQIARSGLACAFC